MDFIIRQNQVFTTGQRFRHIGMGTRYGTVRYLRDDTHEKAKRAQDPTHYYYHVDFDDNTFETYLNQMYMVELNPT
jgi:hypothetical protein